MNRARWTLVGIGVVMALCLTRADVSSGEVRPTIKDVPKGAERAVQAVKDAFPTSAILEVSQPNENFGPGTEKGIFWSITIDLKGAKRDIKVTPEGTIIHLPTPLDSKDVPEAVSKTLAKEAPEATIKQVEKREIRAVLRHVARTKAKVSYVAEVQKGEDKFRVQVTSEGKVLKTDAIKANKQAAKPAVKPAQDSAPKRGPYTPPKEAEQAVKAVKDVLPEANVIKVELTTYTDGSGDQLVVYFEVEFLLKGVEKEWLVTPDGLFVAMSTSVEAKDLPEAVAIAIAKAVEGGKIQSVTRNEGRTRVKFVPLEKPKIIYTAQVETKGELTLFRMKQDGSPIQYKHALEAFAIKLKDFQELHKGDKDFEQKFKEYKEKLAKEYFKKKG